MSRLALFVRRGRGGRVKPEPTHKRIALSTSTPYGMFKVYFSRPLTGLNVSGHRVTLYGREVTDEELQRGWIDADDRDEHG